VDIVIRIGATPETSVLSPCGVARPQGRLLKQAGLSNNLTGKIYYKNQGSSNRNSQNPVDSSDYQIGGNNSPWRKQKSQSKKGECAVR